MRKNTTGTWQHYISPRFLKNDTEEKTHDEMKRTVVGQFLPPATHFPPRFDVHTYPMRA